MAVHVRRGVYSGVIPLSRLHLGAWLVILTFVPAQFVKLTFFEIGGRDFALQEIAALVIFPLAFILMGRIRIPILLAQFGVAMIIANSAAYVAKLDFFNPKLISGNLTILTTFFVAAILYTALTQDERAFSVLGRLWVVFAVATSILTVLQAVSVLPLWSVPESEIPARVVGILGLYRGAGLDIDPNYQALLLVIGVVYARFYVKKYRTLTILLILLGIVATFSRMGILVAILAWIVAPIIQAWTSDHKSATSALLKAVGVMSFLTLTGAVFITLMPQSLQLYIAQRVGDVVQAYSTLMGGQSLGSAGERAQLVGAAWDILWQHPLVGVGAYQTEQAVADVIGRTFTIHNAYLDALVIGGIWGGLAIATYFILLKHALTRSCHEGEDKDRRSFILTLLFAMGLIGFFLTLHYSIILWLPLVLALAHLSMSSPNQRSRGRARLAAYR